MATIRENNGDAAPDATTQYTINQGDVFQGSLDPADDKDWVRIDMTAGPFYDITLNDEDAFELHILDPEGNEVTIVDYDPSEIKATFITAVSGAHYICISSNNDDGVADYEFSVSERTPPPVGTYDDLADFLAEGFWGRIAFDVGPGGVLTADVSALTEDGQQLISKALDAWTSVTGIEFELVDDENAHLVFTDDEFNGAFAAPTTIDGVIISSHINVPVISPGTGDITLNVDALRIILHEIGHGLGLGHPGPYNYSFSIYGVNNAFQIDSYQATLMSYFNQERNTLIDASVASPVTPMIADIIAIQKLYGVPTDIRSDDTVYGYQSNVDGYLGELFALWAGEEDNRIKQQAALTLYDNGGNDTLDLRTDTTDQRIDLRPEGISDVYGLVGNLVIARDTVIENFIAGSGDDEIIGNSAANRLVAGDGNDWLSGNAESDVLEGGAGTDTASYRGSDAGVTVKLKDGTGSGGHAEGDTLSGIEYLIGSDYADIFGGDNHDNRLVGMDGNDAIWGGNGDDVLEGGAGADRLNGGIGEDTASYAASDAGVVVRLHSRVAQGGHADGDTFIGLLTVEDTEVPDIEHLTGSVYADILAGDLRDNILRGSAGDDTLYGGPGGGDDRLYGDEGNDRIFGGKGDDTINGGAGEDTLSGGRDADTFVFAPGDGNDNIMDFGNGEDRIDLSAFTDITSIDNLSMEQQGDDVLVDLSGLGGGTITVSGFDITDLHASDFIF